MQVKPHPFLTRRKELARRVARFAPRFNGVSRWALEVSFLTAAWLYDHDDNYDLMTDAQWDALGKKIVNSSETSPYFKEVVDLRVLKRSGSALSINWNVGIARRCKEMWSTPGWNPAMSVRLDDAAVKEYTDWLDSRLGSQLPLVLD